MLCVAKKVRLFDRQEDGNANDKTLNICLLSDIATKLQAIGFEPR